MEVSLAIDMVGTDWLRYSDSPSTEKPAVVRVSVGGTLSSSRPGRSCWFVQRKL